MFRVVFICFVARDGQARWTEVQIGHQAGVWADRSFYVAGWAALAGEVCCHWFPESGRLLSLRTSASRRDRRGRPSWSGSGLTNTSPL